MPGFIGFPELLLLGLVALIVFGPKRLPEMGRGLGKGLREFRESIAGDKEINGFDNSKPEGDTSLTIDSASATVEPTVRRIGT